MDLKKHIRDVPGFPKAGIIFKDITTLLSEKDAFKRVIDLMHDNYKGKKINKIAAIESRGFMFGGALADRLNCGMVLIRKEGKLPAKKIKESYSLEYGQNTLEMHEDSIKKGEKVVIVDDLLATGGTMQAVINMVEKLQGIIVGIEFVIELEFLKGREKIGNYPINSLIKY